MGSTRVCRRLEPRTGIHLRAPTRVRHQSRLHLTSVRIVLGTVGQVVRRVGVSWFDSLFLFFCSHVQMESPIPTEPTRSRASFFGELVDIIFLGIWEDEVRRYPGRNTSSRYSASPRRRDEVDRRKDSGVCALGRGFPKGSFGVRGACWA